MSVVTGRNSFTLEREMAEYVYSWLNRACPIVKREFATPWGVCDFVGISIYPERVCERLRLGQRRPIGPFSRIDLLNRVPDRNTGTAVSIRAIAAQARQNRSVVQEELHRLVAGKFVAITEGKVQKLNGWAPLHRSIVAVELKLDRVREALDQAISNREFATESYVALPEAVASRLSEVKIRDFRRCGVGMLGVSTLRCRVHVMPSTQNVANPVLQMHCIERSWRAIQVLVARGGQRGVIGN